MKNTYGERQLNLFQNYSISLITIVLLFIVLNNIEAYSKIYVKSQRVHEKKVLGDDPKPKFSLFKLSLEDFSGFKIPDSSFLRQYAKVTYDDVDKILKIYPINPSKSIILAQGDEDLFFAVMYIDHREIVTKFKYRIGEEEKIELILLRGTRLYFYSSINEKWRKYTIIAREFDIDNFSHIKTRILMTSVPKEDFEIPDIIPDSASKILPIEENIFVCKNIDIEIAFQNIILSEDSTRVITTLKVTADDETELLFLCEYIPHTDTTIMYSFWCGSEDVPANYPNVSTIDSNLVMEKILRTKDNLYQSNRLYFLSKEKFDSLDFSFANLIKDFPDQDNISINIDSRSILHRGEVVALLYKIMHGKYGIIGIVKADLDIKQKKIISMRCVKMDEGFREKFGIEDKIVGYITEATGYNNDDLIICIEKVTALGSSISSNMRGLTHEDYYMFCLNNEMKFKWVFANQERSVHSTNTNYRSGYFYVDYNKAHIFITTIDDEPEKGLWTIQIDSETGKVIKSQMLIDFTGMILLSTDCLRYFTGEYYVALNTYTTNELEIFKRKN